MHNLMTDPLIRYRQFDGTVSEASLPDVYAALMADTVEAFPALRPHQRHAWHAFLVQLAAMALHRAGQDTPPTDAGEWWRIIRALTEKDWSEDEPWQLVVEDIIQPAFMQPSASSEERWKDYSTELTTPDAIDTPDTAKNHDLKRSSVSPTEYDAWIFALVTGQTMDAHQIQNPAISRISGGGSRLAFSLTPSTRFGRHARRDITALLTQWSKIGEGYQTIVDGFALLWTVPWDGKKSLQLRELHPLYIEISRRIRLCVRDGCLHARKTGGNEARIAGRNDLKGRTGDPWIPVNSTRGKVLTLPKIEGFTYKQISNLLNSGDWDLPLLSRPTNDEMTSPEQMYLIARGMAPGKAQNKTGGYYERIIPITSGVKTAMLRRKSDGAHELGRIAKERVDDVKKIRDFFKDAIATYVINGDNIYNKEKFNRNGLNKLRNREDITVWTNRLDEVVDVHFLSNVQDEFEAEAAVRTAIRNRWLLNDDEPKGVINHAYALLSEAIDSLPCPAIHRYKAKANAVGLFERCIKSGRGFPDLSTKPNNEGEVWQTNNQPTQTSSPTETQMTLFE